MYQIDKYFDALREQQRKYSSGSEKLESTYDDLRQYMCKNPEARNVGRYLKDSGFVSLAGIEGKVKPPVFITTKDGYTLAVSNTDLKNIKEGKTKIRRRSGTLKFD